LLWSVEPVASAQIGKHVHALHEDVDSGLVQEYKDIFNKVKEWGSFEYFDIKRNGLRKYGDATRLCDFVAEFERKLDSKPGLASDVCCFLDHSFDILGLSRERPSGASHQRNLPSKPSLIWLPGVLR
jgi:hypothetical protein